MKRAIKLSLAMVLLALMLVACAGQQTNMDQAIQYRSLFNSTLSSFTTNLQTLPQPLQQKYATMAVPVASSGVLALDTMDAIVAGGGKIDPANVQQYLAAKNALIDLIAKMILEKGGK